MIPMFEGNSEQVGGAYPGWKNHMEAKRVFQELGIADF
jgi:hypothetical protein